jgi:hypothetical protein
MAMRKIRALSPHFLKDLESGILADIRRLTLKDKTLSMFIRCGYVNVYYRGGNLLRINEARGGGYEFHFDRKYENVGDTKGMPLPAPPNWTALDKVLIVKSSQDALVWLMQLPLLKQCMDMWFGQHPKDEREFQQLIARVNNSSKYTDYFIVDVEYTSSNLGELRADMLALFWPRTRKARLAGSGFRPLLTAVEVKMRDHALTGDAGLVDHVTKLTAALDSGRIDVADLGAEALEMFRQMVRLGFIECDGKADQFCQQNEVDPGRLEYLLLLADHDPDSEVLKRELIAVQQMLAPMVAQRGTGLHFDVKVARAGFCGFGLFSQNIMELNAAIAVL